MIKLFLAFLMLVGAVIMILSVVALSDFMFKHRDFRLLFKRLWLAITWPVSLLSSAGRSQILSSFVKTQEKR